MKFTIDRVCRSLLHDDVGLDWVLNVCIVDPNGVPTFMRVSRLVLCPNSRKVHIEVNGIDEEDECHKKARAN